MDTKFLALIKKRLPWIAAAAALGGIGFLVGQALGGFPVNIAKFMGSQIVRQAHSARRAQPARTCLEPRRPGPPAE